ncbi:MAG: TIR domain-containing protein [Cyanobacteriota bacterium]|nr:TIR domain-containing protein [Cyanobacteriota bacterium]
MTPLFDAFISYGRADSKAFAAKLQTRLNEQGFGVWFDFNDIPLGVDYQNQIDDGIERAHNFLFIIAPHSVNSPYCLKEIELAIQCNKRIIPLLHVEQISRETWQQRNPTGTDEEWTEYRQQGKHDHFQNMHSLVRKINWVYFREGIDDFEQSLTGLTELLRRHSDYVEQHTQLLAKALAWERHQKKTNYLLVGEEKHQAQSWLDFRFKNEQPPCVPTDLHCEYITESIKNGNNLMTQVFLSYADKDRAIMEEIRKSLRRESITVWTNTTDIQTGEAFGEAIDRGIEQADNVIYLLSPDAINSAYCQQELDLALSLNKRIIPILVRKTSPERVPSVLRELQYIDLTDNVKDDDYRLDESKLLKILQEDAAYYNEHKVLLTKALKWKRQNQNPSILLRGYNLRSAETWLKVAQKRTQHPPTLLQAEFITESLQQPPLESLDVFISYSRADSDLARTLNDRLQMQGKTTWFDQESIALGSDFQQEIYRGIQACDNFLFILSPRSISSPYCADEVEYAASLNKRFVTVLHQAVDTAQLHPELAKVQWIDFNRERGDFNANFNQLVRTLDTDREHIRSHSKWSHRAIEWQEKGKNADLLLRGSEFAVAENWLQETETHQKKPGATSLQKEFVVESGNAIAAAEAAEQQRQAELLRLQEERTKEAEARLVQQKREARRLKFGLGLAIFLVGVALVSFLQAKRSEKRAKQSEDRAEAASAEALAESSQALYTSGDKLDALVEALRAKQTLEASGVASAEREQEKVVDAALQKAVFGVRESNRLAGDDGHRATVLAVAISPNGQKIASGSEDNTIKLWDGKGKFLDTLSEHQGSVNDVAFSFDGTLIASASVDKTVKLWDQDGTLVKTLEGHNGGVRAVAFSRDGQLIASGSSDKTVRLWKNDGTSVATLEGHGGEIKAVAFSPDGQLIASSGDDKTVKLWNRDGTLFKTLEKHSDEVEAVAFSPNGKLIASASDDRTVKLWNRDGTLLKTLKGHSDGVVGVAFGPQSEQVVSASHDKTIRVWNRDGTLLIALSGHRDEVTDVSLSGSAEKLKIASASEDNTVRLWKLNESASSYLYQHRDRVRAVTVSPDGQLIASASDDGTVILWRRHEERLLGVLRQEDEISDVVFSPDSQFVVTGSRSKMVKLWKTDGTLLTTIQESDKVNEVALSPDSQLIASASDDNTIKLWRRDGMQLAVLSGHSDRVKSVAFSPNGQLIVSGSSDNTIKLWNRSGRLLSTLTAHKGSVNDVSFSPDGKKIASASVDNTVKLWQLEGNLLTRTSLLEEHTESVNEVAFSPNGEQIASASADNTIKLWQLGENQPKTLYQHSDAVTGIVFSPKEEVLVSGGDDNKVILWEVEKIKQSPDLRARGCNWLEDYLESHPELEEGDVVPRALRDRELCNNVEN